MQPSRHQPQARRLPPAQGPSYGQQANPAAAAPPPPQPTQAQQDLQRREEVRRREAAFRQARKPTDRNIPNDIADVVIGDGVERYRNLRDVERRLDATMMRKRLDVAQGLPSQIRRDATLRLWISNTAEGQPWQVMDDGAAGLGDDGAFDFDDNSQAAYRVKIQGKLLDVPDSSLKLSHFFRSITIDYERAPSLQPDNFASIEWKRPSSDTAGSEFDSLEFARKGDEDMQVTISLVRDETPERYKLSKPLADLIDAQEADRATVVAGIWDYVRGAGLQEDDDNRKIVCDQQLRAVFGMDTLYFPFVPELIHHHLSPLPPIKLQYTIRVDREYISGSTPSKPTIYDIRVPLGSPMKQIMQTLLTDSSQQVDLKAMTAIDDDIALLVQKMNNVNAKRHFYEDLALDPTQFIKRWMSSQQRDLEVVLAEGGRGVGDTREDGMPMDVFRTGGTQGIWGGDLARESVGLWLARNKAR